MLIDQTYDPDNMLNYVPGIMEVLQISWDPLKELSLCKIGNLKV